MHLWWSCFCSRSRSNPLWVFCKNGILKNVTKFTGNRMVGVSFFICCRPPNVFIFTSISLLAAYNSVYRMSLFGYQGVFLNSTKSDDDNILHPEVYNLIRADHSDNGKTGRACSYFKLSFK